MKIVVAEKIAANAVQVLKEETTWTVVTHDQLGGDLASALVDADALIVRSAVQVDGKMLSGAKKLRVVGRAGVGVDNIDVDAATKAGIAVMNTPGANAVAVAEHTLALMLGLARHIPRAATTTRAGKWEKKSLEGQELRGKTLGIIGLGRIGLEVARRARAFDMKLIAHDPFVTAAIAREHGIELAERDAVFAVADYITLHVGLTAQTTGMINEKSLAKMKRGVRIVNCARGELVDEAALAAALARQHVTGAALDVFTKEPPKDSPLPALENVLATPHIAGSTAEAQNAVGLQIASQIREYLKHGVIQNAVNMPSIDDEQYAQMEPYLALAEKLGAFLANIASGGIQEISIRYGGRINEWKTELVRNSAIQGILNQSIAEQVNVVNAAAIAQESGIRVSESKEPDNTKAKVIDFISLGLKTTTGEHHVHGAVLRANLLRLLGVDNIGIEVPLEGNLIYIRNRDVPGVVGKVGSLLGQHSVNIANFALGRIGPDADAMAVVQVDAPAPETVLQKLRELVEIQEVRAIQL